jgi:predicted methyltransferase
MRFALLAAALLAAPVGLVAPLPAAAQQQAVDPALAQVLAHSRRDEDRGRDPHRHPAETLAFFQVRPGMTVVDYMPAGGWFSRVIIPYLGKQGTYIALDPELHPSMTGYWDTYRNTAERFPGEARGWVGDEGARVLGANTDSVPDALAGTADRVLIFREIHNMRRFGWLHDTLVAARKLLKDDGLLGIEQHRAKADAPASYTLGDNGYQREKDVIALLDAYGFDLVASSEINANPKDPADWEGGVWTLPPGYRGAGEDAARRAELDAIGESDRMTLLFRKRA